MLHSLLLRISAILAVSSTLLLSACGGGGVIALLAEVGSGGTGSPLAAIGVVTGFGSLIVDGVRRNDTTASYFSEAEQGTAVAMPMTAAMLGHTMELSLDAGGNITSALMSPEVVGPVSAVSQDSITVLGTRIVANTDAALGPVTSFVGYATLASVQPGDRVEVHGLLKADSQGKPYLQATLIAQKLPGSGIRLTGIVSQYDTGTGIFALGSQTVTTGSATISPSGSTLANGLLVTVWSNTAAVDNAIVAATIRIKRPAQSSGNVTLSGPISNYISNSSFQVRNVAVDASAASITPASASLGNDRYVVIAGNYDVTANKLKASSVTISTPSAPTSVEIHGMVANYVSASSFTLRGVVIDASNATFTGGTTSQLANGVFLEVHGVVANSVVRATTVEFIAFTPGQAPNGSVIEVGGTLSAFDPQTGAFTMSMSTGGSMSGSMGAGAVIRNGTVANLAVGQALSIAGRFSNSSLSGVEFNLQAIQPTEPGIL
ncbi:MAG: DUF5666 domain-containing protein, partial [Sterolibacterium sp.]